jgi:hypothetical protein
MMTGHGGTENMPTENTENVKDQQEFLVILVISVANRLRG